MARILEAARIAGDDGAAAWDDRFDDLRRTLARVAEEGHLADGWTIEQAADWAWARLQPSQWDYLVNMRGWSQKQFAERTTRSVLGELVSA